MPTSPGTAPRPAALPAAVTASIPPQIGAAAPSPWRWIPTLYFSQGLPYVAVMLLAVVMYKNLGVGNTEIALYTSWLYLPWVLKPLWSPLVELFGAKRVWVLAMQWGVAVSLALVAFTLPSTHFVQWTLAMFWLMAFASATHDIAADGFYMLALPERARQAAFVGVRSLFYRLAMLGGQGGLVWMAGWLQVRHGSFVVAWVGVMGAMAVFFAAMALWHAWALPRPAEDGAAHTTKAVAARGEPVAASRPSMRQVFVAFGSVFVAFFRHPQIGRVLAFLLLYRFAEAQLLKLIVPFLLDPPAAGGFGLSTQQVGIAYGTVGVAALTAGGLLGGWVIARVGLKRALWPLMFSMHLPNILYVSLAAWVPPGALLAASTAIAIEQFGYGFGFTAYMVFMLQVASGPRGENPHKTAHYAICTGFMALGMMLPGLWAGWLQQWLGYTAFFIWCCVATLPSFAAAALVRIEDEGAPARGADR